MKKVKVNEFISKIMFRDSVVGILVGERIYGFIRISVLPVISIKEDSDPKYTIDIVVPEKITIDRYSFCNSSNDFVRYTMDRYMNVLTAYSKCDDVLMTSIHACHASIHIKSHIDYDETEISVMIPAFTSDGDLTRIIDVNYNKYDKSIYVYYGNKLAYKLPIDGLKLSSTDIKNI